MLVSMPKWGWGVNNLLAPEFWLNELPLPKNTVTNNIGVNTGKIKRSENAIRVISYSFKEGRYVIGWMRLT